MPGSQTTYATFQNRNASTQKEIILVFSSASRISNCFINALQIEFPDYEVFFFNDFNSFDRLTPYDIEFVKLVILHQSMCEDMHFVSEKLQSYFSRKKCALAFDNNRNCIDHARSISGRFGNHLPMDVRLDVWLAIIRLLLSGGNYHASDLMVQEVPLQQTPSLHSDIEQTELHCSRQTPVRNSAAQSKPAILQKLTTRELDVLKLLASGLQNKIIASNLGLSEHTVKLHVHHIISKLDVTNRTEAASVFLSAHG